MVNLNKDIIQVINKVSKILEDSPFVINNFEVGTTGADGEMIQIDIRRHKKDALEAEGNNE